jgi:alpha-L-rhamnosidase
MPSTTTPGFRVVAFDVIYPVLTRGNKIMNTDLAVDKLRCEYKVNPLGIGVLRPRLSWQMRSRRRGACQTAYQIAAADDAAALENNAHMRWDSGRVESDASIHVPYGGPELRSGERCAWRVRIWDETGAVSPWSEAAWWEMGLLSVADWQAAWITPAWDEDKHSSQPCPLLRRVFGVRGPVRSARLYATALGLYACALNGQRIGDQQLTPGWTSYDTRLQYQTYDVTELLAPGDNALSAVLADGWYRGHLGFQGQRNTYGDTLALLVQLRIEYEDGSTEYVYSDETWRAAAGPWLAADFYNGEVYDARLEQTGWQLAGFDDRSWSAVRTVDPSKTILIAQTAPPVRKIEEIRPIAILHTPAGETVFDFGQNMVGWVQLRVAGPAGATVTLRHSEVLDSAGNFYTENLRAAQQRVDYTLRGNGEELYEPRFTFMGFRYIAVEGIPGEPSLESLTGVVVHSDMAVTGRFGCSEPLLNQLQHNILWGQKGNFVDVPTDCPQRDERLGWTGDAQVFIRTACFNMDVAAFFTKWLGDLAADQTPNGSVPFVVPDVIARARSDAQGTGGFTGRGSTAWGDAAVICPWTLYLCYGDTRILETQYASMAGWVRYMEEQAGDDFIWDSGFHFGDWLSIFPEASPLWPAPKTSIALIATTFFAYCAAILAEVARILQRDDEAARYAELFAKIKAAFCAEFVSPNGRIDSGTQTAYVLALMFDLLPEAQRPLAAARLVEEIRGRDYHLSTGFVGTPYLCHVLSRFGYLDVAYRLLNQRTFPSWLYPVRMGATTIWERWDGIRPDGTFQDPSMNSFNHYAYGAVGDWMYQVIAGLNVDPYAPGYKHVIIHPRPGGGLTSASAELETPYGRLASSWTLEETGFHLKLTVPPNTRATVYLPAASPAEVSESGNLITEAAGIDQVRVANGSVSFEIGAGDYSFVSRGLTLSPGWQEREPLFTTASRLGEILSDIDGRAVLLRHLGADLLQAPQLRQLMSMRLEQAAGFAPTVVPPQKLAEIAQELERIR